jgi:type VI secretion system protein ImpK
VSTNDPQQPSPDDERTILIPSPGGKRGAAAAATAASAPVQQAPMPSPGAGEEARAPAIPRLGGYGLNPLVAAASPLLDLVLPLRHMASYPQVEHLRQQLVAGIKTFEQTAKAAQVPVDAIAVARYSLCTFLDETISATPWGSGGVWSSRSLLVTFHNEASGGEKFFLVLQKLCQDPGVHIDVLELMYLCLSLGLEGRYRVLEGGRGQLEILRERLLELITRQRGAVEPALSMNWRGAGGKGEALWRMLPVWVVAAIALSVLVLLHMGLSYSLSRASTPVHARLHGIAVAAWPGPATATAAPLPAPAAPARVAKFLAPEIEQGLVSVSELPDRSIITLMGNGVFAPGSAEVTASFVPLLQKIGDALRPVDGKVKVVGHTDNTTGFSTRFPSNWDLSKGRAATVARMLGERAGPPERYSVEGRGDTEPVAPNDSAANRAHNRRVVIMLLAPPSA